MSTPANVHTMQRVKSFGHPLQATSPFPLHAVHLIAKVAFRGLLTGHGTRETRHHNVCCDVSEPLLALLFSSGASSTSSSRRSRPSCSPPRPASAADGLVVGDGTDRKHNATTEGKSPHSLPAADPESGSNAREVTPSTSQTFDKLDTAYVPARQVMVCLDNNCHKARLGRAAPATARSRWGQSTRMTNFCVTSQPTLLIVEPETVSEEREERRVNLLHVVFEPNLRWSDACLNL